MNIGITHRLFLAILAAASLVVVCMLFIMQWNLDRGFLRYINGVEQARLSRLADQLETIYEDRQSWDFLKADPGAWRRLVFSSIPDEERPPGRERAEQPPAAAGGRRSGGPPFRGGRGFVLRVFLLDDARKPLLGPVEIPANPELKPLRHQGRVVGYLGLLPHQRLSDERQLRFLKQQRTSLWMVAAVILVVAAGLSLPLANRLVRPIRALARATDRLAAGEFDTRVPITSNDELGHLARDFNSLALTLERNEQARRQWVADISHELRTPLAVLRGEIEAIQDGIRQPTPETIRSLHGEALRLGRLVDDLYQLSLSDLGALTYRKEMLDPAEPLEEAVAVYRPEFAAKGITLELELRSVRQASLFGDGERLHQLFANLLDNGLKYTDPGGTMAVRLQCQDGEALIDFEDSAPGVPESELTRLFERLYRVEGSRSREAGGAGLGLAICRNIVEAHAGTITALPSPLGGVRISVVLPLGGKSR